MLTDALGAQLTRCCCKMQLCKSQENSVKTVELYLGLIKITLNDGSCVLITNYQEFKCDWLITNTATPPGYHRVGTLMQSGYCVLFFLINN